MNHFFSILAASAVTMFPVAQAATTEVYNFNGLALGVPDGNPTGLANLQSISSAIIDIDSVELDLGLSGGFNGDLYVSLNHSSGFAVLMNRVGRTAANSFGYADDGINVTFDDTAVNNIHTYQAVSTPAAGNPLTGTWQPDGRNVDPDLVVDTDPVTAGLSVFANTDASGDWTLFVADLSSGESHTLDNWSLTITGTVPEPSSIGLVMLSFCGLLRRKR